MATPPTLPSKIEAVQVYRRGATVFRTAQLVIGEAVPDEVELTDLPLSLFDPTLRVRVLAAEPAGADVVAAGVRVGLWVRPGDPPPKAPEQKELEEVRKKLSRAREQGEHLDLEIAMLTGVPVPDRPQGEDGKAPPPSPMAARLHLEQFVDEATRQRIAERRKLRDETRALEEEETRIQERIAASSSAAEVHLDELRKSATVRLRARPGSTKATRLTLELSYVVPGARWAPAYQCKLARDGSRAEIQLRAWVAQRSGEDWRGVKLRLSTASPLRFTELPELASVKIGRAQPAPQKKGFRAPPQGGELLFRDFDRDAQRARGSLPPARAWSPPQLAAPEARRMSSEGGRDDDTGSFQRAKMKKGGRAMVGAANGGRARDIEYSKETTKAVSVDEIVLGRGDDDYAGEQMLDSLADEEGESLPPPPREAPMAMAALRMPAPAPPAAARAMEPMKKRAGPGGVGDDILEAVAYPLLRLPAAADGGRGRLMPSDARALYAESVARLGRPVKFDVLSAVQRAENLAQGVTSQPTPDGTVDADDISSHFDFAYEADGLVEIVGDGGFHSVALGDRSSEARMRYIAVPREELAVYRVAMLTNPIPAPLLPGPAEIYVGGEYVLTTRLPTVPARGELKLGLGVEQAIKIARNTKFNEVRSGEKVVAMTELVHDIDIEIVNHLEREIDIEVRERVPIPATGAEVVVEESAIEPAWQPYDQEERGTPIEGGRRWEVKVAKAGTQKLKARYVVKIYANNEIQGGNRREQ